MRYYEIRIINQNAKNTQNNQTNALTATGQANTTNIIGSPLVFTSWVQGPSGKMQTDPGALDVEFNFRTTDYATSPSIVGVTVYGVSLKTIAQANDINNWNVYIYAGFKKGLPLADISPQASGLLLAGNILQAYGSWVGNEMTLNLIISPGLLQAGSNQRNSVGSSDIPLNGSFFWKTGQKLSEALYNFLKIAFPDYNDPQTSSISDKLIAPQDWVANYKTLYELANGLKSQTKFLLNPSDNPKGYQGVSIRMDQGQKNTIVAYDGTSKSPTTKLQFQNLIGQPVWFAPQQIQFACPMRTDIRLGDTVQMPEGNIFPAISPANPQSVYAYRDQSIQQGLFTVIDVHHFGRFRQPTGDAWKSVYTCIIPINV